MGQAPLRLACEPITEAGATLLPTPDYSRSRPAYLVTLHGRQLGEVRCRPRRGWSATANGRELTHWIRYDDGCIGHRCTWDDRQGAVAAVIEAAAGVSTPVSHEEGTPP